jgi:hypothetical protein
MLLFKETNVDQYRPVSIAKCCRLNGPGIENLWGRIIPQTHPQAHLSSYTRRASLLPVKKCPLLFVDLPPPHGASGADIKEIMQLYFYFHSGPSGFVVG